MASESNMFKITAIKRLTQTLLSANDEVAGGEPLTASEVEALKEKASGMKLEPEMIATENEEETAFVAFARVFSG